MTQELNLFTNETTSDTKTNKVNSTDSSPKEGKSLFDNLLSDIEKQNTTTKQPAGNNENETTLKSNVNVNENGTSLKQADQSQEINPAKTESTKEKKAQENKTNPYSKVPNDNKEITKEDKPVTVKVETKTMSLLDRMMLEANETIVKDEITKETNVLKSTQKGDITPKTNLEVVVNEEDKSKFVKDNKVIDPVTANKTKPAEQNNTPDEKSFFDSLLEDVEISNEETLNTKQTKTDTKIDNKIDTNALKTQAVLNPELVNQTEVKISDTKETKKADNTENKILEKNPNIEVKTQQPAEKLNNITKQQVNISPEKRQEIANTAKQQVDITPEKTDVVNIAKQPVDSATARTEVLPNTTKQQVAETSVKTEVVKQTVKQQVPIDNSKAEVEKNSIKKTDNPIKEEILVSNKESDVKKEVSNEVQTTKNHEKTVVKNVNVANELAKITNTDIETKVNISKEDITKLDDKTDDEVKSTNIKPEKIDNTRTAKNEKSLMDRLVEESKNLAKFGNTDEIKSNIGKTNETAMKQTIDKNINPLMTNIYLSTQQGNINNAAIAKVSIGKNIASNAVNVKDVEKSAEFLELGLENTEVNVEKQEFEKNIKMNNLDKLAFVKTVVKQDLTKINTDIVSSQTTTTNTTNNAVVENETVVQLNVSAQAAVGIESRIIGARQQMGSMMSDVARNMYLNYKPPVTAFKINLMPANLGSIAITMKSDKENGLSISLNMSNNSTLDSFVDNQSSLRAAIAKNFDTGTNFSLDFNMQNQNNSSGNSNNQNSGNQNTNNDDATTFNNADQGTKQEDVSSNYM